MRRISRALHPDRRSGQAATEYVVILGGMMLAFILFNVAVQDNLVTRLSRTFTDLLLVLTTIIKLPL